MRILVADDALIMRTIHRNVLLELGVDESGIVEASDGKRALELASAQVMDLFLVDWNMPELNGLEFVKTLRALVAYRAVPIIMITSEAAKYNVLEAIEAGVTNYIVKPVKPAALKEKLGKYLVVKR